MDYTRTPKHVFHRGLTIEVCPFTSHSAVTPISILQPPTPPLPRSLKVGHHQIYKFNMSREVWHDEKLDFVEARSDYKAGHTDYVVRCPNHHQICPFVTEERLSVSSKALVCV